MCVLNALVFPLFNDFALRHYCKAEITYLPLYYKGLAFTSPNLQIGAH